MDINNHIYTVKTSIGSAKAFRVAGTRYLLTTEAILNGISHCTIFDAKLQRCEADIIITDTVDCMGVLYLLKDSQPSIVNYRTELIEDSYDVSMPSDTDDANTLTGYISNFVTNDSGHTIYYHTITISTAALGSPLLDESGLCIGITNASIEEEEFMNYAIPIKNYLDIISKYEKMVVLKDCDSKKPLPILHRCDKNKESKLYANLNEIACCPSLEEKNFMNLKHGDMNAQISKMLTQLNFDLKQSKLNKNEWIVKNGSAVITIGYHEKKGLLTADAVVVNHHDTYQSAIYEYLLRQNYILEGLNFSVVDQDIILSIKLYDNYIEFDTMLNLFKKLLIKADELDDVLVLKLKN